MKNRTMAAVMTARNLSPREVSERLGVAVETLNKWRCARKGPPFIRVSARCIRYPEDKLAAWNEARAVTPEATN